MPPTCSHLLFRVGTADTVQAMPTLPAFVPFAPEVVEFLAALSARLLAVGKAWPDVVSFAFWCRRASLAQMQVRYDGDALRLGLGVVFHSTPANVPVNFAFSLAAGLLAGNANVVRLPRRHFPQVECICSAIDSTLQEHSAMRPYLALLAYPSGDAGRPVSDWLSSLCDARVVWGGDATIAHMRQSPLPPRARELTFADRTSIAVLRAGAVLAADIPKLAHDFYNDTYLFDQNACTAPHVIVWLGNAETVAHAQEQFWHAVHSLVQGRYALAATDAVGKLAAAQGLAAMYGANFVHGEDNLLVRARVKSLVPQLLALKYHSGFFMEYVATTLEEIAPLCTGQCQTVSYFGLTAQCWQEFFKRTRPRGIDRCVPMGKTTEFDLEWDGHDLIRELSRSICQL